VTKPKTLHTALAISGATCQGCVNRIRTALEPDIGDQSLVEVDLEQKTVALPDHVDSDEEARRGYEAGYSDIPIS